MTGLVPFLVKFIKSYTALTWLRIAFILSIAALMLVGCKQLGSMVSSTGTVSGGVFTYHNDNYRTGRNLTETTLNRTNVNSTTFGKIGSLPVDGQVYAQPLVANGVVTATGAAPKNLAFIATENDSVYAFDITSSAALQFPVPVWHRDLLQECNSSGAACSGVDPVTDVQVNAPNISPIIGITATPVIDPTSQTIYLTAMTKENGVLYWRLHALSLATGAERSGSPVTITGVYSGTGAGSVGGLIPFSPVNQLSRAGLVLNNGIVTVAFTSFDDNEPTHGWVFSYDATTLNLAGLWMTTPKTGDGTIWQSGGAPAVDDDGSLIFATGNGDPSSTFANMNPPDLADSIVRIKMGAENFSSPTSAYSVQPADFFTPYNHVPLATGDVDLGSGGVLLLPTPDNSLLGTPVNLALAGGKQGTLYLVNRSNMGKLSTGTSATGDTNIVQELVGKIPGGTNFGSGIYGTPSYYNGKVYMIAAGDYLRSIPFSNGLMNWSAMQNGTQKLALRGATASISASGGATNDAILWYLDASAYTYKWITGENPPTLTDGSAVLYAVSTDDPTKVLYSSPVTQASSLGSTELGDICASLDPNAAGCAVKFAVPTVQNGMVLVGTDTEVSVYGLLNR